MGVGFQVERSDDILLPRPMFWAKKSYPFRKVCQLRAADGMASMRVATVEELEVAGL